MGFYCNGKKGICDLEGCPDGCEFFNNSGGHEIEDKKPMTYGDCMRAMSDEGLAGTLNAIIKGLFLGLNMSAAAAHDYTAALCVEIIAEWLTEEGYNA